MFLGLSVCLSVCHISQNFMFFNIIRRGGVRPVALSSEMSSLGGAEVLNVKILTCQIF